MEIINDFGGAGVRKKVDADNFLLTNRIGGYASLSGENLSKFQGVYFAEDSQCYKAIENIVIDGIVTNLRNRFTSVLRERGDAGEFFFMPKNKNAFVYELSRQKQITILLDCRKQLDFRKWGRNYRIYHKNNILFVKYTKKTHKNEDRSHGKKDYEVYIAIQPDKMDYAKIGDWVKKYYSFDMKRKDEAEMYVYSALKINASKLVFGFGTTEEKALENLNETAKMENFQEPPHAKLKFILDNDINTAYLCAQESLDKLFIENKRIFAGLPWFNQFWSRDELISVGALMKFKEYGLVKDILMRYVKMVQDDGRLPNRDPATKVSNADSIGWLFKRLFDLMKVLQEKQKLHKEFSAIEIHQVKHALEKSIEGILKNYSEGELIKNKAQETWCDTKASGREGFRIEIQALQLNMYAFMKWLCMILRDKSGRTYAEHKEERMKNEVVKQFWNGHYLNDGVNDNTIRPNVFLAHYIYPDLLSDSQWRECFDNVLQRLFTGFGLSSIDMHNPKFRPLHTGVSDDSYHNGDSWYWINNIAAISMYKVGKFKFGKYIQGILKGSTTDILWQGVPGCASEISSAAKQESFGCFNQAWSDSTYIEMIDEMF